MDILLPDDVDTPFRMQPGLQRVARDAVRLHPLQPGSAHHREKSAVLRAGAAVQQVPGFDAQPALQALAVHTLAQGLAVPGAAGPAPQTADPAPTPARAPALALALALAVEEDFVVLDGASGTVPWMCVCLPSHWAPEARVGQSLSQLHAPVADNRLLMRAAPALAALVTDDAEGLCWQRHVWTLSPSARLDQHPLRQAREPWPDDASPAALAARTHWRVERQSFLPVGQGLRQAVFVIHVQVMPLTEAVRGAAAARQLHAALASMSPAVQDYKGLRPALPRLLAWLDAQARLQR